MVMTQINAHSLNVLLIIIHLKRIAQSKKRNTF